MTGRRIHVGYDVAQDLPDTYRLYAECDDEITSIVVLNPTPDMRAALLPTQGQLDAGAPIVERLLTEHAERCSACRAWIGELAS